MWKATYTHKCYLLILVWVRDGKRGKIKGQPQGFPEEIKTWFGDHSEASIGVVCSQFKFLLEDQKLHCNGTKPLILSFIINLPYTAAGKILHLGRMKYSLLDTRTHCTKKWHSANISISSLLYWITLPFPFLASRQRANLLHWLMPCITPLTSMTLLEV